MNEKIGTTSKKQYGLQMKKLSNVQSVMFNVNNIVNRDK